MSRADDLFDDWKRKADQCDLLATAVMYGAKLKRAGREHVGPCVACGGSDRFSINPGKNLWHCRGHGGGLGAIGMTMHIAGLSFLAACEALTGEPNPRTNRPARPLSEAEQAERNRQRLKMEDDRRRREAQETAQNQDTVEFCAKIIGECVAVEGTLAERYLHLFDLPTPPGGWPECLMFHPALNYPGKGKMPALVARVDDVSGQMTGIWREFIRADGRKADVEFQKLGLGPVAGGAVRMGGMAKHIGTAEGVRSALGAWALIGWKYPVWPCLSTSGLIGFEVPLGVERITIYQDGDRPIKKHQGDYIPAVPAGRKAALTMQARVTGEGVLCDLAAEPPPERDYLQLWQSHAREVA